MNPVGVLASGGISWLLRCLVSAVVTGGDMAHNWEELGLCEAVDDAVWACRDVDMVAGCCMGCCCCIGCCDCMECCIG